MKLLAVHPSCLMYSKIYLRLEPMGLELVASAARGAGHDVRLIDLQAETHKDYFRWIRSWSPDAVVFSCNYLANVPEIIDLAKATRTLLPHALIMVGGHSASFTATEILQHGEGGIDAVLKGHGAGGTLTAHAYAHPDDSADALRLKLFVHGEFIALSECLPVFENLGLKVIAEDAFALSPFAENGEPQQAALHGSRREKVHRDSAAAVVGVTAGRRLCLRFCLCRCLSHRA